MPTIPQLPTDTNADENDLLIIEDSLSATTRKIKVSDFKINSIGTDDLQDNSVTDEKVAPGAVVQVAQQGYSAVQTMTADIPLDGTIPQVTEGEEIMSLTFTPKSTTNTLIIQANIFGANSSATSCNVALFTNNSNSAIAVAENRYSFGAAPQMTTIQGYYQPTNLNPIIFTVRQGTPSGTYTFNGSNSNNRYGSSVKSSIVITEYKAL